MNATKSGVQYGSQEELFEYHQEVFEKGAKALRLIREPQRRDLVPQLERALDCFLKLTPFETAILQPKTFADFLALSSGQTMGQFNQLASELKWWALLDQIEEDCFWKPNAIGLARSFVAELWQDEVAANPFKPPQGWKYLSVPEGVEQFRKVFGASLKADSILKLAKQAKPRKESGGIPVWIKLTTLAKLFSVSGNPLEITDEGREAYAQIVQKFIPEVGKAYTKAYPKFGFKNWRENQLTNRHIILTPAGRKAWRDLEANFSGGDDFVVATAGANTGSLYAGYSVRRSRICITLAGNQFPQDCIMVGSTIMIQPGRHTRFEDLGTDCPGNAVSPDADGDFESCVYWSWVGGKLHFDYSWTGGVDRGYGSGAGFRS